MPTKRRSFLFGSRHLTYDMPFPIDECTADSVEFRRRPSSRRDGKQCNSLDTHLKSHKDVFRANSLEMDTNKFDKVPVVRNVSSPPTTLQYTMHRFFFCLFYYLFIFSIRITFPLN